MKQPRIITIDPTKYRLDELSLENVPSNVQSSKGIRIHTADGRLNGRGPTYIVPRSFQAMVDVPFEQLRDKILATSLQARVIGIDTPGVGFHKDSRSTSLRQKWNATRGNLSAYATMQLTAIQHLFPNDFQPGSTVHFIGYSLGAKIVAEMIMSSKFRESGLRVGSIDFIELVNDEDWKILGKKGLRNTLKSEETAVNRYLVENLSLQLDITTYDRDAKDPTKTLKGKKLPVSIDSRLIALGMRKGGFSRRLAEYIKTHPMMFKNISIAIYRASGSHLARARSNQKAAKDLGAHYFELHPPKGMDHHRHPLWFSLGGVGLIGKEIAKRRKT